MSFHQILSQLALGLAFTYLSAWLNQGDLVDVHLETPYVPHIHPVHLSDEVHLRHNDDIRIIRNMRNTVRVPEILPVPREVVQVVEFVEPVEFSNVMVYLEPLNVVEVFERLEPIEVIEVEVPEELGPADEADQVEPPAPFEYDEQDPQPPAEYVELQIEDLHEDEIHLGQEDAESDAESDDGGPHPLWPDEPALLRDGSVVGYVPNFDGVFQDPANGFNVLAPVVGREVVVYDPAVVERDSVRRDDDPDAFLIVVGEDDEWPYDVEFMGRGDPCGNLRNVPFKNNDVQRRYNPRS